MILKIKQLREEIGLTQKELADRIGNVQRNISNWENGTSEPDCETLLRLAEVFGVSLDELFGREGVLNDLASFSLQPFLHNLDKNRAEALKNFLNAFCK